MVRRWRIEGGTARFYWVLRRSNPMMTATSPSKFSIAIAAAAALFCLGGSGSAAAAPMPDTENGRYALAPVAGGVLRLDTRTGAVSTCNNTGAGWACYAVPDEPAALAAQIGRLPANTDTPTPEPP